MTNVERMVGSPEDVERRVTQREAAEFEMLLARTYTRSYVAGLEIGTRLVNPEAKGAVDEYDGGPGMYGYEQWTIGHLRYSALGEELLEEEGMHAIRAVEAGIRAGREHPIKQLETKGVAA